MASIIALFGTNPYPFERLVGFLERLVRERGYQVVAQVGQSRAPDGCRSFAYASHLELMRLIADADVVVAQGGYGSSLDAISRGRPLVLVPRLRHLKESLDDQQELADYLASQGRATSVRAYGALCDAIENALTQTPSERERGDASEIGSAVANEITDYLQSYGIY